MSSPSIKLKKLSIANFRGAKNPVELDLSSDCRSVVVYGANGEGKSTFSQAIEWFYRDKIAALSGEGIASEDIINLIAGAGDKAEVSLTFNDGVLDSSKAYSRGSRSRFSNRSQEFTRYVSLDARYDRLYLNQHVMLWFMLLQKGKKKEELAKIIGYETVVGVRDAIVSASRELERTPRLSDLRSRVENNRGVMTREIFGESVDTLEGLFNKAKPLLKTFGLEEEISSLDEYKQALEKALASLPSEEKARDRVECQNILTQLENFPKPLGTIAALGKWTKDFNNIAGDKANVSKLDLDVFLRQGEKILLDESSIETCPLCEQPIDDPDALLKRLKSRYRKLEELREKLHQCESDWGSLAVNLRQMPTNLRNIKGGLKSKKIPCDFTVLGKCVAYLEQLIAHVEGQIKIRESCAVNFEVLNNVMDKAVSELRSAKGHIDKRIAGLAVTAEEKLKHDAYSKLLRGRDLLLQNLEYQKELRAYEKQIADMRYVSGQVVSLQNETLRNVLDTLASDVNKFFCFLNNRDAVKDVKFELVGDEGIEFSLSFYGREATPPRKYLSDSQQNSLGIAFFLAAVKNFNRTNKFFVLDDVLISFDKDYRVRLLELLERDFSDYQVVLLTHEDHWYETIKRMFPKWVHKEVGWSFTEGISFKGISQDWLNAASQRLNSGEKIGNELRIGTEGFLKQICISLDVRLPFRLGIDNDRRTNGELYSDLTATLNGHKCSIKDDQRYKQFGMLNFLMTASSHHNPGAESRGDMQELIRKIHDFRALFVCPDGEIVRRDSRVPGENKISCRCGKLKVEWKE